MLGHLGAGFGRIGGGAGAAAIELSPPSGFAWTPTFGLFVSGSAFSTDYDIEDDRPDTSGWRQEFAASDGSTSNTSSTEGAPVSLRRAVDNAIAADVPTVIYYDGSKSVFRGSLGWDGRNPGVSIALVPNPNKPAGRCVTIKAAASTAPSYTKTGGQTNVYQMTTSAPIWVLDRAHIDAHREIRALTAVGSIAAVDSTPNSWFHDGTVLYVHVTNGAGAVRAADADVQPLVGGGASVGWVATGNDRVLWLEDADILGASTGLNASVSAAAGIAGCQVLAKSCTVQGSNGSGFQIGMQGDIRFVDPGAYNNKQDGLSYAGEGGSAQAAAASPDVLEVRGRVRNAGTVAASNDNASTAHGLTRIIRVNPDYDTTYDRIVHDVAGVASWMLGGTIGNVGAGSGAAATVDSNTNSAAVAAGGSGAGTATIFIDGAVIATNADDDLQELTGGAIKVTTRTVYNAANVTGSIESYTP